MNKVANRLQSSVSAIDENKAFELMQASLLPFRNTWQPLAHSLPKNAYLIVTRWDQKPVNAALLRLANLLRRQGQTVYMLSVAN